MRYIQIPSDVRPVDLATGDPLRTVDGELAPTISFYTYVARHLLTDRRFGAGSSTMFTLSDIRFALKDRKAGEVAALSDNDWNTLKGVVEKPSEPFVPLVAISFVSYMRAILDAKSELPEDWPKPVLTTAAAN